MRFLVGRLISLALVCLALVVATFLMVRLVPGDPARAVAGARASPIRVAEVRAQLGLTGSLAEQFLNYVRGLAHFDLGMSFLYGQPVSTIIEARLPNSAELAAASLILVMVLGVGSGILVGALTQDDRRPVLDAIFTAVTGVFASLPVFLIATILVFLFAVSLKLLPVASNESLASVILPALSIALLPAAALARIVRLETWGVLRQDYIRTARSKRLPARLLYGRHVLRNVLTSALTIGGVFFAQLVGGAIVVENIFAWPGMGTQLVDSVINHDYPVVEGITLVTGTAVVVVNAIIDVLLAMTDPRSVRRR